MGPSHDVGLTDVSRHEANKKKLTNLMKNMKISSITYVT